MDVRRATVVWFAAEVARTETKYRQPETLLLRDAGALLALLNIVACTAGMNFCALGPTGDPHISKLFGSTEAIRGTGGFVVGNG